ncbi:hypothetical protein WPS_13180 [Vulcanimicrobium alpinum]|uniref:Uncharacterized protein n=1 Tax=Vulcanimicrobium alpinum TaxID=3016050 RepID=A0AAN2C9W6_UNVUL|nr:hypothetical protein [Vulcanimicrobium alpinum]BDE06042.1 hypothetical protein WPS_13180 [Vulcanimicrobium alpinum]
MTDQSSAPTTTNVPEPGNGRSALPLGRTLLWLGVAGASAALTFVVLRITLGRRAAATDETAERIQALIDEANRLIKTLDEKKQV